MKTLNKLETHVCLDLNDLPLGMCYGEGHSTMGPEQLTHGEQCSGAGPEQMKTPTTGENEKT